MIRARFKCNPDDYRPVTWPPPGPYWCTGFGGDDEDAFNIVVAYADSEAQVLEFWPDAHEIDHTEESEYFFNDRFARPDWWPL